MLEEKKGTEIKAVNEGKVELTLTPEEKAKIEDERKEKEITQKCVSEITEILKKYNRELRVIQNPQIIIQPKN